MKEAKQYYDAHHEKLIEACSSNKDILLLDIHSFNAQMASFLADNRPLPDIYFGLNNDDSSCPDLVEEIIKWGKANCPFTYAINDPYQGSILSNRKRENQKFYSLMLEITKAFYL